MRNFLFLVASLALAQTSLSAQLPVITNQPASQTVWTGVNVTFVVGVTGAGPFTYQWQHSNTNLPVSLITSVAGGGIGNGGPATNANVYPTSVAVDAVGNIFIADSENNRVRKVATNGIITTYAGNGDDAYGGVASIRPNPHVVPKALPHGTYSGDGGAATNAGLYAPADVALDAHGNLFIADEENNRIRKVDTNGIITTVAGNGSAAYGGDGGAATNASLWNPSGVALDVAGNLFIADFENSVVRKVGTNGIITTVAGTNGFGFSGDGGMATNAALNGPSGVAVDAHGNLFIVDSGNERIRKVGTNGIITTYAGTNTYGFSGDGGQATNAILWNPTGVSLDSTGNVFIADSSNNRIRKVGTNGIITTVAGTNTAGYFGNGGPAVKAGLDNPRGTVMDTHGNLFIADSYNYRVRKVATTGIITTVAGNGSYTYSGDAGAATKAGISDASDVGVDTRGNVFVCDTGNALIRKIGTNGIITTYAGNRTFAFSGDNAAATNASLDYPDAVALDVRGNLFIADLENNRIRKVATNGIITTVAGNGTAAFTGDGGKATNASLSGPSGVAVDATGNLFIADASNQRVRRVGTNGIITTYAGNGAPGPYLIGTFSGDGGAATNAGLSNPTDVAVDAAGNLFIADAFNYRIRRVGTNGIITTYAGSGARTFGGDGGPATNAALTLPYGMAVDSAGDLFFADSQNERIRKVDTNGIITSVAGDGTTAFAGDGGAPLDASLSDPAGVAVDSSGNLFIADTGNRHVRKVTNTPMGPVLGLTDVTLDASGGYQVEVTGADGSVTSSVAFFTVTDSPLGYKTVHNANGSLALSFVSQPGSTNVVLSATNLAPPIVWLRIFTNVAAATGDWQFTDTNTARFHTKYYRSLTPTPP